MLQPCDGQYCKTQNRGLTSELGHRAQLQQIFSYPFQISPCKTPYPAPPRSAVVSAFWTAEQDAESSQQQPSGTAPPQNFSAGADGKGPARLQERNGQETDSTTGRAEGTPSCVEAAAGLPGRQEDDARGLGQGGGTESDHAAEAEPPAGHSEAPAHLSLTRYLLWA